MPDVIRNTRDAWGSPVKFLHWAVALLVLAQFPLGWAAVTWRLSPLKLDLFVWHKSIGISILALMVVRLMWRLANQVPALPKTIPAWEGRAARLGHFLLYAMLFAMPLSGWVVNSAANIPFRIFWRVPLPSIGGPDKVIAALSARVHLILFIGLAALLLLHIVAALRHHLTRRNNVLVRMLPRLWGYL
ncbi:MAG TPA: cytochrome b [Casimicrobiaceae bacterium]|nr:cytochrome b [Casimicrobiaceae bacterium]